MRKLRRMWRGKFRVWCITHGHRFRLIGLMLVLALLFLLMGYFDWRELYNRAETHRQRAEYLQQEQDVMKQLPKTVYVIEAATPEELMKKMSRIAGELDYERYKMMHRMKEQK